MKTTYSLIATAAILAPAFGGTATVVESPIPAALTAPAPAAESVYSVEIGVSNNWAQRDIGRRLYTDLGASHTGHVDSIGTDITFIRALDKHNSVNLRLGYAWGHGCYHDDIDQPIIANETRYRTHTFSLMPGYRFTAPITDSVSTFIGVNVGLVNSSLKTRQTVDIAGGLDRFRETWHDSDWGFGYSAEVGLSFAVSKTVDFFVAYQFSGSTARPKLRDNWDGTCIQTSKHQVHHGVRAGMGFKF